MLSLPSFCAAQRSADIRFLMVPGESIFDEPMGGQLLDVLGLKPLRAQTAMAHLVQLIGHHIQDVFAVGLRGITSVAVNVWPEKSKCGVTFSSCCRDSKARS